MINKLTLLKLILKPSCIEKERKTGIIKPEASQDVDKKTYA